MAHTHHDKTSVLRTEPWNPADAVSWVCGAPTHQEPDEAALVRVGRWEVWAFAAVDEKPKSGWIVVPGVDGGDADSGEAQPGRIRGWDVGKTLSFKIKGLCDEKNL